MSLRAVTRLLALLGIPLSAILAAPGPEDTPTLNRVRYAHAHAASGDGSEANPWTGWESCVEPGAQVHFAAGYYETARGIEVSIATQNRQAETRLTGDGMHSTFIRVTEKNRPALWVHGDPAQHPALVLGFLLEGISFFAGAENPDGALVRLENLEQSWSMRDVVLRNGPVGARGKEARNVGIGLDLYHCSHGVIENLVVRSSHSTPKDNFDIGVRSLDDDGLQRGNNTFVGGLIQNTNVGVVVEGIGNSNNNNTFLNTKTVRGDYRAGTVGFWLKTGSWGTGIFNTHVEGFETGVDIAGGGAVNIIGGLYSRASDNPLRPDRAKSGAAIHIHGSTLGVMISTPIIVASYRGVLVEGDAGRVRYLPGITEGPAGIEGWNEHSHWVDRSSRSWSNHLGFERGPFDVVSTEIPRAQGGTTAALGGKILDLVARGTDGTDRWRLRWQAEPGGWAWRVLDPGNAPSVGTGRLLAWNRAGGRLELARETRILDSSGRPQPAVTGTGSDDRGVVLWGNPAQPTTDTANEICSAAGLACVAASETDGTDRSCEESRGYPGSTGARRFLAFCK